MVLLKDKSHAVLRHAGNSVFTVHQCRLFSAGCLDKKRQVLMCPYQLASVFIYSSFETGFLTYVVDDECNISM